MDDGDVKQPISQDLVKIIQFESTIYVHGWPRGFQVVQLTLPKNFSHSTCDDFPSQKERFFFQNQIFQVRTVSFREGR